MGDRLGPNMWARASRAAVRLGLASALGTAAVLASAQSSAPTVQPGGPLAAVMGIDQHFNTQIPLDAVFRDETGRQLTMRDIFGARSVIILPMFFGCNGVCRLEVEDLFKTLEKDKNLMPGRDFDLVMLSINPTETPKLALEKKNLILSAYHVPGGDFGVHALTGNYDQIRKVTNALGFRYSYDPKTQIINHPAGMMFLDKNGYIRGYMYGAEYPTAVIKENLDAANKSVVEIDKPVITLLGCIMTDPKTGRRTLIIENIMKVIGSLTALTVGGSIWHMSKKYKTPPIPPMGGNAAI